MIYILKIFFLFFSVLISEKHSFQIESNLLMIVSIYF